MKLDIEHKQGFCCVVWFCLMLFYRCTLSQAEYATKEVASGEPGRCCGWPHKYGCPHEWGACEVGATPAARRSVLLGQG